MEVIFVMNNIYAKNKCIVCGKAHENGIIICGKKICRSCEENLIECEANTDFYKYYMNCIKKQLTPHIIKNSCEKSEYL